MAKEIENIASDIFDKIRSRVANVSLGDESQKNTQDPAKARFFNFEYTDKAGTDFGPVSIIIVDEKSLKLYYAKNITDSMDREQRKEWYEFIRGFRLFTKRNPTLRSFDVRDIAKPGLDRKDVKQQAKVDDVADASDTPVVESKLYGTPGRPYNSFEDQGTTKILVRHEDKVNDEVRGARTRRIKEIFLETEIGERFLLGHTNLHGARAMAQHLNHGGQMHDEIAEHINGLVTEMSAMSRFVRIAGRRQFEDQETSDMTHAAIQHYTQLKRKLRHLSNKSHYQEFLDSYVPDTAVEEEDIDVDALRERFVKKIYDDRFTEALPLVYKAYKKYKAEAAGQLGTELEEWADTILEDDQTSTDFDRDALKEKMKSPWLAGMDGIDVTTDLSRIFIDADIDDLLDSVRQHSDPSSGQGSDFDCRVLVKQWLNDHMPEALDDLEIGQNDGSDAQTNWVPQVSPQQDTSQEYGASTMDEPNVNEAVDSLEFIRSLAGLKR